MQLLGQKSCFAFTIHCLGQAQGHCWPALCWGVLKAVLAWGPSPGLVFEFSCQSRTSQALQGGFIWGQLNRHWMKHREEQHPWPWGDFSPPQCWLSCVEAQMGLKWPTAPGLGHGQAPPESSPASWGTSGLLWHPWTLPC